MGWCSFVGAAFGVEAMGLTPSSIQPSCTSRTPDTSNRSPIRTTAAQLWGGDPQLPIEPLFSDTSLDLQHRRLLSRANTTASFELAEHAILLLARILERAHTARVAAGRPSTAATRRRAVDEARELLASRPGIGLFELARAVAVSPHHLSRIFADATGSSISEYRNRVRVRIALDRIADGERSLAQLAADLGFADHAHLTRVVRRQVGDAPSRLRALLSPPPPM